MSDNNSKDEAPNDNDENPSRSTNLASDEASQKLEDHRCAICENVLINACRIGCGHTFCRHCLNLQKESRNERGKPTCFICDAAVTEISHNSERDKEIDKLYMLLSTDERLSRERTKAKRKAEEEELAARLRNEPHGPQDDGFPNETERNGSGDACCRCHDDAWSGTGRCACAEMPDTLTIYFEENPNADWQVDNNSNHDGEEDGIGEDIEIEFLSRNDYEEEGGAITDYELEEVRINPNPLYDQQSQAPIIIHHTIQHIYHTVDVRNNTTYYESEGEDGNGNRRQSRHAQQLENNCFSDDRNNYPSRVDPPTCRRAHQCTPPFYYNPCPTYNSNGYHSHYNASYMVPNFSYNSPNMHTDPSLFSPVPALPAPCYRVRESYPVHPSSPLMYSTPSSQTLNECSGLHERHGIHERVPNRNIMCGRENVCECHRHQGAHDCSASPRSSGSHIYFVEEATVSGDDGDDILSVGATGSNTNCQCEQFPESDEDVSDHHEHITLSLTIPIPENITIRTRDSNANEHRPPTSDCSDFWIHSGT